MNRVIVPLLLSITLLHSAAAQEPFIPAALNGVLPRIRPGMSISEVEAVLSPAYPNVKGKMGLWSGQSGYIDYKLDERYSLSVSSFTRDGKAVVHDEVFFNVYDWPNKRRLDVKVFEWDKQAGKKASDK